MPAPQLLVTDGVDTVTLDGTDGWIGGDVGYTPSTPSFRQRSINTVGTDGGEQDGADYDNVSETAGFSMLGSTTTVRANIEKLTRLFDRARRYNVPGTPLVYIKFRPDSSEAWYRSQIMAGRVMYSKDILGWEWINSPASSIDVVCIFTRRFFWEADAESEIQLMAEGDASPGATGGKTVSNHDDGGHGNLIDVAAGSLSGDVRVPVRLEMNNISTVAISLVYVGREQSNDGTFMVAVWEGENATPLSNQADANSSGGNYNRLTWSGTTEADIATWSITSVTLAKAAGRWLRIISRFSNTFAYTDLYLRFKLVANGVTIFQGEKQLMAAGPLLQEIGSLPFPPRLGGLTNTATMSLVLQATRLAGGSMTLDVDFIQLTLLDSWRKFTALSTGLPQNDLLTDDGTNERVYSTYGTANYADWSAEGLLMLKPSPSLPQRLRFLWQRAGGSSYIDDQLTVKAFYRPRRLTL